MKKTRDIGLSHIYFDSNIKICSNVSLGLIVRAIGANLRVCFVDINSKACSLNQFFLNLGYKNFFYFNLENLVLSQLDDFDVIIFDNCNFERINKEGIKNILEIKPKNLEIIFTFSKREQFDSIKDNFDLISEYNYKKENKNAKLINITGNGKGKSTYIFGMIIKFLIENKRILELIYFDKGGDFYSEREFFKKIKSDLFKFEICGNERFDGEKFRFKNIDKDFSEAKRGLKLFEESKSEVIFLDELNTTIKTGLLEKLEVINALSKKERLIVISGRYSYDEIKKISDILVEVVEIKHYIYSGFGVRKGIDF